MISSCASRAALRLAVGISGWLGDYFRSLVDTREPSLRICTLKVDTIQRKYHGKLFFLSHCNVEILNHPELLEYSAVATPFWHPRLADRYPVHSNHLWPNWNLYIQTETYQQILNPDLKIDLEYIWTRSLPTWRSMQYWRLIGR